MPSDPRSYLNPPARPRSEFATDAEHLEQCRRPTRAVAEKLVRDFATVCLGLLRGAFDDTIYAMAISNRSPRIGGMGCPIWSGQFNQDLNAAWRMVDDVSDDRPDRVNVREFEAAVLRMAGEVGVTVSTDIKKMFEPFAAAAAAPDAKIPPQWSGPLMLSKISAVLNVGEKTLRNNAEEYGIERIGENGRRWRTDLNKLSPEQRKKLAN